MTQETIVAAFDTAAQASAAARDVEAAGIPAANISQHASDASLNSPATLSTTATPGTARREPGFWAKLFGEHDDYAHDAGTSRDQGVYGRTIEGGGAILSIVIPDAERDGDRILSIIEHHNPVDVEERAAFYENSATAAHSGVIGVGTGRVEPPVTGGENHTVQLAEETLQIGKRIVNRGTTRIRRYVVETPVSEDVSLRNETVSVERRPVSGAETVGHDAFTDKTIEVTAQSEEVVVGKTARIVEEVAIRKNIDNRVETVHDTVRRDELEIEKIDGAGT